MLRVVTALFRFLIPLSLLLVAWPAAAGEGRTPIYAWTTTITAPGKYIVTRDIAPPVCLAAAIDIQASHVDIDLNGFRVFACPGVGHAAIVAQGQDDITIRNGTIGFADWGIQILGGADGNRKVVVEDVKIIDVVVAGIELTDITDFALRRNNITTISAFGIVPPYSQDGVVITGGVRPSMGTIEGNQIEATGSGITVRGGSSIAIRNNRLDDIQIISPPPAQGAIVYEAGDNCVIAENTIEAITDGSGIYLGDASGCKIYNNAVHRASDDGIEIAGVSDDNLILDNVATNCGLDGLRIEGSRNHVERNVLNSNCQSGVQGCWGLHFSAAAGGADNLYRGNTARGNFANPAACPYPGAPGQPPTTDFCDEQVAGPVGTGNTSLGDNFLPAIY